MNPITAKEIIESDDIISKLNDVKGNLEGLRTALQDAAKGEKLKLSEIISTKGMEDAAAKVRVLADAMEALRVAYKENEEMIRNINNASTKEAELRKANAEAAKAEASAKREVIKAERELQRAQQQTATSAEKNAKAEEALKNAIDLLNGEIDVQKLSYNQLSSVYSLMSTRLKNMSAETIQSTEDNKKLALIVKLVRDQMNDLAKAMGNYSLNVGRYHTAFDGLGFSIQQVLREVPSAINISQFFLAISNNIPMVVDQIKAFKTEQAEIKKDLGDLKEGTKEYMELQSKQMSLGQKMLKSILSWQTAILAGLLLLRKLPSIIDNIKKKAKELREALSGVGGQIKDAVSNAKLVSSILDNTMKTRVEIKAIVDNLSNVKKGTDEWENGVRRIDELMGSQLLKHDANIDKIKEETEAYIEQQRQIAINNEVIGQISSSYVNEAKRKLIGGEFGKKGGFAYAMSTIGIDVNDEKYGEYLKIYNDAVNATMKLRKLEKITTPEQLLQQYGTANMGNLANWKRTYNQQIAMWNNIVNKSLPINSDSQNNALMALYSPIANNNDNGNGSSAKEKIAEYVDFFEQMMQARHNVIKSEYERELEDENNRAVLEKIALDNAYKDKLDSLKKYGEQQGLKQQEIDANASALRQQYFEIDVANAEEHQRKIKEIEDKWTTKRTKEAIKNIDFETKANLDATNVRVRGIESEIHANEILIGNIKELEKELLQLLNLKAKGSTEEGIKAIDEAIQKTQSSIDKLANKMSFRQRATAKNFSLGNLIKNNMSEDGMASALIASGYTEGEVGIMKDLGQVEEIFGMKLDNTLNALKTWKDTTIDYIGDIIDAYIQLAEAKAEAAREETETAKEEYEKQKSLMDAGYANSMETAYMEYREKQELQRQAEQEAKQAQKAQQAIDTASQISSLITASANIWAQATKTGAGLLTPAVAAGLMAAMWGSFAFAKVKALQIANYGDGGYEIMQGGSHASGHDIDLGVNNRNGKRMHVEGGEGLAVISNKAKRRYGHSAIESVINSINNGTFDVKAGELTRVTPMVIARGSSVSLNRVENTLNDIKIGVNKQSYVTANGDIIEIEGSLKRTIHTR